MSSVVLQNKYVYGIVYMLAPLKEAYHALMT